MTQDYDYSKIEPPSGEDPTEWHFSHRRAWILENEVLAKGGVEQVNWNQLADQFDKAPSTLHRDKERLVEYLGEDVDEEEIRARGRALFESLHRDLLSQYNDPEEDVKPERVANFYRMWLKTLREFGQLPPAADDPRHNEDGDGEATPDEISVGIAGVPADGFDPDELEDMPEQDRPKEQEAET